MTRIEAAIQPNSFLGTKFLGDTLPLQSRLPIAPKKKSKKKNSEKRATMEAIHEKWFFDMPGKRFAEICLEWNEYNLKLKIPKHGGYDEWLNYFKTLSPTTIKMLAETGQDILSTEAYAALSRWHDIIGNPHRIEKIHQSGLTADGKQGGESITKMAANNDRLGVLKATRDRIAEKLQKGAGARDTAALAREMTDIMTQIADYEKRKGPKKDTVLRSLLDDAEKFKKRPGKNGGGSRNTSFKSRVTIEDVEGDGGS